MLSRVAARSSPLTIASFMFAAVPMTENGSGSSSSSPIPHVRGKALRACLPQFRTNERLRHRREVLLQREEHRAVDREVFHHLALERGQLPATSIVWPAISPSPWPACMSPM